MTLWIKEASKVVKMNGRENDNNNKVAKEVGRYFPNEFNLKKFNNYIFSTYKLLKVCW